MTYYCLHLGGKRQ